MALIPSEHDRTRVAVRQLRDTFAKQSEVDVAQAVANFIYNTESAAGSRFLVVDGRPCLFTAITRQLLDIGGNKQWNAHLFAIYGINTKEKFAGYVTQCLESHCVWNGEAREARRWVAFVDGVLHVSNYDGYVWRVSGAGVVIDPQTGRVTDDGWGAIEVEDEDGNTKTEQGPPIGIGIEPNGSTIVFADDDEGKPVASPAISKENAKHLFKMIGSVTWDSTPRGMLPKHQTLAVLIWVFAIAFPDLFPTKPLLIVEGAAGGGKSSIFQLLQIALRGVMQPLIVSENGEKDFRVSLLRTPVAVLDNTDDYIKWLPNALAAYATGGGWVDRELFTNQGVVKLRPQAFIAVASKNPVSFRADDVADRSIVLRTARRKDALARRAMRKMQVGSHIIQPKPNTRMDKLKNEALRLREQIFGGWLYHLNRIVAVINSGGLPETAEHRMADWEAFTWAVARAFNWDDHVVVELLEILQRERTAFASENDTVVELVEEWLDRIDPKTGISVNEGRWITQRDLYKELKLLAELGGKAFVKSPMGMVHRLRSPHVVDRFYVDDTRVDIKGEKLYWISRQLSIALNDGGEGSSGSSDPQAN